MTTKAEQHRWIEESVITRGSRELRRVKVKAAVRFHEHVLHFDHTHTPDDVSSDEGRLAKSLGTLLAQRDLTPEEFTLLKDLHVKQAHHTLTEPPSNITRLSDFRRS